MFHLCCCCLFVVLYIFIYRNVLYVHLYIIALSTLKFPFLNFILLTIKLANNADSLVFPYTLLCLFINDINDGR